MRKLNVVVCIIFGLIMGILSKLTDVVVQGTLWGNICWNFGLVTSAFLIWCVIGYAIAVSSKSLIAALINNFSFYLSMLISYYIYSHFVVHYLEWKIVLFWVAMLVAVLVTTVFIKLFKRFKPFRILCNCFLCLIFAFDTFVMQGLESISLIMEAILLIIALVLVNKKKVKG